MSFYGASNNSIEIISSIKSIFPVSQLVSHSLFLLVRKNRFIKCTWFTLRQRFKGYYGNFVVPFCGRLRVFWPCIDLLLIDPFRFLFVQSSLFCELFCRITSKPISERTTSRTFFSFWLDNQSESFFLRVENWRERKRGKLKKREKTDFLRMMISHEFQPQSTTGHSGRPINIQHAVSQLTDILCARDTWRICHLLYLIFIWGCAHIKWDFYGILWFFFNHF